MMEVLNVLSKYIKFGKNQIIGLNIQQDLNDYYLTASNLDLYYTSGSNLIGYLNELKGTFNVCENGNSYRVIGNENSMFDWTVYKSDFKTITEGIKLDTDLINSLVKFFGKVDHVLYTETLNTPGSVVGIIYTNNPRLEKIICPKTGTHFDITQNSIDSFTLSVKYHVLNII